MSSTRGSGRKLLVVRASLSFGALKAGSDSCGVLEALACSLYNRRLPDLQGKSCSVQSSFPVSFPDPPTNSPQLLHQHLLCLDAMDTPPLSLNLRKQPLLQPSAASWPLSGLVERTEEESNSQTGVGIDGMCCCPLVFSPEHRDFLQIGNHAVLLPGHALCLLRFAFNFHHKHHLCIDKAASRRKRPSSPFPMSSFLSFAISSFSLKRRNLCFFLHLAI